MDGLAPDTLLVFDPGAKAPAVGGVMSLSRARYLLYSAAVTVAEFRALHPGTAAEARRDFRFDATRGHVTSPGLSHSVVHAVRTAPAAPRRRRTLRSWRDVPDRRADAWVTDFAERLDAHRIGMAAAQQHQAELDRLDGLEPRPPPPYLESDLDAPEGVCTDPRRVAPAYVATELRVRAGALEDYGAAAAGDATSGIDPFGPGFDIPPAAVIFGANVDTGAGATAARGPGAFVGAVSEAPTGVDPRTVPPRSVHEPMRRADFAAPFGWKESMWKEVNRIKKFKAWRSVPISEMFRARKKYGAHRVSVGYVVSVLSCKADPTGDPRGGGKQVSRGRGGGPGGGFQGGSDVLQLF